MTVFTHFEAFLKIFCLSSSPLLLALSGGPDSLCLFYCLLMARDRYGLSFHIAHVDHGWREESREEAQILEQLALDYHIPFHLKTLEPGSLKGNLEAACREERYAFFSSLCHEFQFQGVMTGHHQDDQAETICKRILEGAHWFRWMGLKPESWREGMRVLRPLLKVARKEILQFLEEKNLQAFEDPTNRHSCFLRARLRETIFPRLNQEFGKEVQKSFIHLGEEAKELTDYFEERVGPVVKSLKHGLWGTYLNLQTLLPSHLIEIKYLIRLVCESQQFFLSREIIEEIAHALQKGKACQLFTMKSRQIWVDRRRLFIFHSPSQVVKENQPQAASLFEKPFLGDWEIEVREEVYTSDCATTSWEEGWQGYLCAYLPIGGHYLFGFDQKNHCMKSRAIVKKRWSQAKIPSFLVSYFPFIYQENGKAMQIRHEFLTGQPLFKLEERALCWKVELLHPFSKNINLLRSS